MAQELAQHEDLYATVRVHKPSDASDHVLQRLFGKAVVENAGTLATLYVGSLNEIILDGFAGLTWEHFSRTSGGADNEYGFFGQILSRMHYQLETTSRVKRVVQPYDVVKALLDGMDISVIDRDPNLPPEHPESGLPNPRLSIDIFRDHWERAIDRVFNQLNPAFRIADIYPNVPGSLAILHIIDSLTPQKGNDFGSYLEVN
ncbi:hypothetical protein GC177_02215 [bacterium]|nr:hypothetical protein [bacterium]